MTRTFKDWQIEAYRIGGLWEDIAADWRQEREQYEQALKEHAARIDMLIEAAWEVVGECGLNGSVERLEAVLEEING